MRLNFRLKLRNVTVFGMISHTQTLKGITNKVGKDKYFIMWDLENCTLEQAEKTLRDVQARYDLGDIFIVSDTPMSFRAFCYSIVTFRRFIMIVCDTEFTDWNFIHWSIIRGEATLRTSRKQDRKPQKCVSVLYSYAEPILEEVKHVVYDTGIDKKGKVLIMEKGVLKFG